MDWPVIYLMGAILVYFGGLISKNARIGSQGYFWLGRASIVSSTFVYVFQILIYALEELWASLNLDKPQK